MTTTSEAMLPPAAPRLRAGAVVGTAVVTAVRVGLGIFWVAEGVLKYRAGFGAADILLVVDSSAHNTRVAPWFQLFATQVMGAAPGLFGFAVPLIELVLGLALILGVGTGLAAVVSVLELTLYWSSDQLIAQYPIMLVLSLVLVCAPAAAARLSLTRLVLARRHAPAPPIVERWL